MKNRALLGLVGFSLVAALSGCGRGMMVPALFGLRVATTAALVAAASTPRVVVVEEYAPPEPFVVDEVALAAASVPAPPAAPPGFDAVAAHGAVDSVDVSSCWPAGSVHGYGTARITFSPKGTVDLVEIVNPVQGAAVDGSCLSQKYGALSLPAFSGGPVAVRAKFFVG